MTSNPLSILKIGTRCLALLDKRSRISLTFLAAAILVGTGLETVGLTLVLPLLQFLVDPAMSADTHPLGFIISALPVANTGTNIAIALVVMVALLFAAKNIILLGVAYMQFSIVFSNERDFACKLFDSYLSRPFTEMLDRNTANLIRNVREVVSTAFKGVIMGFVNAAIEGLMIVAILSVLVYVQPYSALVAMAFLVPCTALYQLLTRGALYRLGAGELDASREIIKTVQEGMHSLKSTKVFGREKYFGKKFRAAKDRATVLAVRVNTIHQTPRLWFETVIIFAAACIVAVMLVTSPPEEATPVLGLFAVAMMRLMPSINRLTQALNNIRHGSVALETLETEYLDAVKADAKRQDAETTTTLASFERISFEHVTHNYPSKEETSLKDVTFEISTGETIALVGPSGAGKTTVADLLLGLLHPTAGAVTINGIPLSQAAASWRDMVAYVPQQVYLSDDTLRRNVAFALPDDAIDDARVMAAMKDAQIKDLLHVLPEGLDTPLGEQGRRLSVGQQQRVGIARALYDQPKFLVLDEATSALDVETEKQISSVISGLSGKLTIVIIAHRLSTVKNADRIILIRDGAIAGAGTFPDLLAQNREFANMVELAKL